MTQQVLKQLLVGLSALDVEALWDEMNTATLPYGRKGLAVMAISGVDLALHPVEHVVLRLQLVANGLAHLLQPADSVLERVERLVLLYPAVVCGAARDEIR